MGRGGREAHGGGTMGTLTLALLLLATAGAYEPPSFKEFYAEMPIDHFNAQGPGVFKMRYLVQDQWYDPSLSPPAPILFYTGNEGHIENFWNNTGFMFDIAPSLSALVVFGEHRYYGKSLPFADASWDRGHIGYLSIDQALADFAGLIGHIKTTYKAQDAPVIAFGGSYGGMLSTWLRLKYPHAVDMAFAASAPIPIASVHNTQPNPDYYAAVTKDAHDADPSCPDAVRAAFAAVDKLAQQGPSGLAKLREAFGLCRDVDSPEAVQHLVLWAQNAWGTMAMMDYPYESDFEGSLPPHPINEACAMMANHSDSLSGLSAAVGLLYGPPSPCHDMYEQYVFCADQSGCGTGPDGRSWDYQVCTEVIYTLVTNNQSDMFPPRAWGIDDLRAYCMDTWGVQPRPDLIREHFGGADIGFGSRIIFSNGLLDPWHTGGFLSPLSPSLPSIIIPSGAHHLDLRGATPHDPQDVIDAREAELAYLRNWLKDVYVEKGVVGIAKADVSRSY